MMMIFKKTFVCAMVVFGASSAVFASNVPSDAVLKNPSINQVWQQHLKGQKTALTVSNVVLDKAKEIQQSQAVLVNTNAINIAKALKNHALNRVGVSDGDNDYFNALVYQLADGYGILANIANAANNTRAELFHLRDLAEMASRGAYSQGELKDLDAQFQLGKYILPYLQSVDLIDGHKILSGGAVKISIGETETNENTLILNIPAFNPAALGVANLAIDTQQGAQQALDAIDNIAMPRVTNALNIAAGDRVSDAEIMLQTVAFRLAYSLILIDREHELAMQSANGMLSNEDRHYLDASFTDTRDTMTAIQSYVSLSGLKKLGGGDIHIQIGNQNTPETTLAIKLPVTDVHLTGFDAQNIKTQENAYRALDAVYSCKHYLIYGN
jgi:hypothetical protein